MASVQFEVNVVLEPKPDFFSPEPKAERVSEYASERNEVLEYRARKDQFFRDHANSPIPAKLRQGFEGLKYYADDARFVWRVHLELDPSRPEVIMRTSNGSERIYERYGWVRLELNDQTISLAAFTDAGNSQPEQVFIPFRDATSGSETYGAGRYLEALIETGDVVSIDLNLAYNPTCAYADGWSCPVPPLENRLNVAVRAGEKAFLVADQA